MGAAAWFISILVLCAALAYLRIPLRWSSLAIAGWLTGLSVSGASPWLLVPLWVILAGTAVVLNTPRLRRRWISDHAFMLFRAVLPTMSATEREALEAGGTWWDAELFSGRPRWKRLLEADPPRLSEREQAFLDGPVEALCRMLDDWRITHHDHDLSPEAWHFIKTQGFFGMIIPRAYGGLGFSALGHSAVVMKVASRSITAATTVMVPNSLGPAQLLLEYGTDEQRRYYLPRLARGEEVPCFALTGPEAGSDAASMPDTGIVCRGTFQGREITGIRINWDKRYITLAPVATVLGLAFKLHDPEHLLGKQEELGITLALIPADTPGVVIGRRHLPLDIPFQNGPTQGKDVFIPLDWIIGGVDRAGRGWLMLMECLADGRSISLPALSTASGKVAARAVGAYARVRRQFKRPIGRFEGVEDALARIAGTTYLMDAVRRVTTVAVDSGCKPSVLSAIAKYHLTERMRTITNDAMDVLGGAGICLGPRNVMGRGYQGVPISITVEGANILTRNMIIFGQGAIRCHPYVLREMEAVAEPDAERGAQAFDRALFAHAGFVISNAVRALFLGLTGARLVPVPGPRETRRWYRQVGRMSAALALATDTAMIVLGGSLKRRERLSARLGDVLSHLYLVSACLRQHRDQGAHREDLPLLEWACADSLARTQEALLGLLRNFPNRPVAWMLRVLIFPLGAHYRAPSDALCHRAASLLLEPSPARHRLTEGIFVPEDPRQGIGRLEYALARVLEAEPIERRLQEAVKQGVMPDGELETLIAGGLAQGLITEAEAAHLREAQTARHEAITVDDFPPDLGLAGDEVRKQDVPAQEVLARDPGGRDTPP
ncbi:acyl-coenzyme A dehydrogenase [bacterium BMS3Bbin12]|nr:acyl-coenzyme A dehydrogenase [bacterium BMS3Abin12]GBE47587.1 acyl-coenzyme A dehydrogenase [bacterium BMS3Bbin12]GBE50226.1 acyl-coenzyme A dehydrogenase [bacterium BMS3Bbin13]